MYFCRIDLKILSSIRLWTEKVYLLKFFFSPLMRMTLRSFRSVHFANFLIPDQHYSSPNALNSNPFLGFGMCCDVAGNGYHSCWQTSWLCLSIWSGCQDFGYIHPTVHLCVQLFRPVFQLDSDMNGWVHHQHHIAWWWSAIIPIGTETAQMIEIKQT